MTLKIAQVRMSNLQKYMEIIEITMGIRKNMFSRNYYEHRRGLQKTHAHLTKLLTQVSPELVMGISQVNSSILSQNTSKMYQNTYINSL